MNCYKKLKIKECKKKLRRNEYCLSYDEKVCQSVQKAEKCATSDLGTIFDSQKVKDVSEQGSQTRGPSISLSLRPLC